MIFCIHLIYPSPASLIIGTVLLTELANNFFIKAPQQLMPGPEISIVSSKLNIMGTP